MSLRRGRCWDRGSLVGGMWLVVLVAACAVMVAPAGAQPSARGVGGTPADVSAELRRMSEEVWTLYRRGDLPRAVEVGETALALATRHARGPDDGELATARFNLAVVYRVMGGTGDAVALFRAVLDAQERTLGAEHPDTLATRDNLAFAYADLGRTGDAVALFRAVLAVRERTLGAEHPDSLSTRMNLAVAYAEMGRTGDAVALYREVLDARERTLGAEHPDTLLTRHNLAVAYADMRRTGDAAALYREVLAVQERTLGAEHPHTLATRMNLANTYYAMGRTGDSVALYREVLAVRERTLGAEHPGTLATRNNLAVAYFQMGRTGDAVALYREVLVVRERTLRAEHPDTLRARMNLAGAYAEMGRTGDAVALNREVLRVQERTLGAEHPHTLATRMNLANVYADMGRTGDAVALYREVLAVRERTLGAEHPDTLMTRENLAVAYAEMGRTGDAVALYREVLAVRERTLGAEHPDTLMTRENLARAWYTQGDIRAAGNGWAESLGARNSREARLAASMGEAGRVAVTRVNFSDGDMMSAGLQTREAGLRRVAAAARVARHARSNEGVGAMLEAARRGGQQAAVDALVALQAEYARLANSDPPDLAATRLVGQRIDQAWAELAGAGVAAEQRDPLAELEAVWRALGPEEVLVHVVRYRPFFPQLTGLEQTGPERYAAFILRGGEDPTGAPGFIDLGLAATLDESVTRFHGILMGQAQGNVLHASSEVYARLVRPLRPLLGAATTVFVVSDGATAQVPWHALVTSMDGGPGGFERYLMDEGLTVLTLSSARELVRTLPAPSTRAAVVMAPFAGVSPENNGLPGTAVEARAVATMLGVHPRLTGDASYAALRTAVQTAPRVLHIATHGYAQQDRGNASPLSFVGLRFAPGDGEDARVSASRMAVELPLLGTDLVVLSACESGLGSVTPGQDIASTRQAFHIAGARHVLASLWPVDDAAAAFFMERFYTHVLAGVSVVQAHSRALRETRDHGRRGDGRGGPYSAIEQWAPFALSVVPARGASLRSGAPR